ncbi:MAG: D-alanyl-D-alanine carboxypeptidase/D-alanyl-D-alanine-endopeptidase [candidate division Zixibacteria bacterium]|nr:D-alanyl-D-alanine carboxypeptidase/D-alanyl-D-alanine-endopeptidase [candidate division Zixibacteria bacterium]
MKMKKLTIILALILLSISTNALADSSLDNLIKDNALEGAFIGIEIKDLSSDSSIYAFNPDLRFSTASNLKLFTSAAALEMLGPDYRFETSFYTNGKISKKGELKGDLLIAGGGDPLISGRFRESITEVVACWVDSLKARGIKKIKGDLVIDNSFFEPDELAPGWSHDYLSYWYACSVSALSFNDNCVDTRVYPAKKIGDPCLLEIMPQTDYIDIVNNTSTIKAGLINTFDFYRHPGKNIVEFFGGIALDDTNGTVDYISVDKPHLYCANIYKDILRSDGIEFNGKIIEIDNDKLLDKYQYKNLTRLFNWRSLPMSEVIAVINKNSQNLFAELTLKTLGAEICGEGSFRMSTRLIRDWLESIGISDNDVFYHDGSGLSHMNLASPSAIVKLLDYMRDSPNFDDYYESLAIPGVDRSVRRRLVDHPQASQMRTKTGSIANTRTFAGYLTTRTDKLVAFSLMINNYSSNRDEIDDWMDKLCVHVIENY